MKILGIETSCDETAASVLEIGARDKVSVLSNIISSQINIHKKYGGVVPEVAAREHVLDILPVINEALEEAGIKRKDVKKKIDAIAVATGPGLITSLLVGVETAKVLAYAWNVPVISVNHIEAHLYANFINLPALLIKRGARGLFPSLILTVSGGHTMLVLMKGHGKYETIGETRDDAAGEAFDKAAAMLGIGYPGGPVISKYADAYLKNISKISNFQFSIFNDQKLKKSKIQNPKSQISLPRPMIDSKNYDFSFSGLKTALLYKIQKDSASPFNNKGLRGASSEWKKRIPEYCFEFQQAVIDVLIKKTIKAAKETKVKTIMLAGGVSANIELRKQLKEAVKGLDGVEFLMPDLKYTTDNAAMMAMAGYFKAKRKKFTPWNKLKVDCNAEFK